MGDARRIDDSRKQQRRLVYIYIYIYYARFVANTRVHRTNNDGWVWFNYRFADGRPESWRMPLHPTKLYKDSSDQWGGWDDKSETIKLVWIKSICLNVNRRWDLTQERL